MLIGGEDDNDLGEVIDDTSLEDTGADSSLDENADTGGDGAAGEGAGTGEGKPVSLRDALIKATKEAKANADPANKTGKNAVPKDPTTGKFKKPDDPAAALVAGQQPKPPLQPGTLAAPGTNVPPPALTPSNRFPEAMRAELSKLPPAVIQQLNAREEQVHQELTRNSEERKTGSEFNKAVAPYMAQIRSENTTPINAVAELFNMAYFLRTATPQQKGAFLWRTAQQFNADMRQVQQGQAVPQQQFNPQINAITQQVNTLQQQLKQQQDQKAAAEQEAITSQINTFKADAAHPHFDAVALDMAAMLQAGRAQNLQDAYDKAIFANPEIRSIVMAEQVKADEQKRVADQKAKADAARKAGSSVRGGPGSGANKNGKVPQKSLRDEIAANLRAVSEG